MPSDRSHHDGVERAESPGDLSRDPKRFWLPAKGWDDPPPVPEKEPVPALKRLGPLPFPRGGFPLMGFFASVYEHIAEHAEDIASPPEADGEHGDDSVLGSDVFRED